MVNRTARYQGGSIVSFVIIAILIAGAIGVGLFMLRQRSEQAKGQPSIASQTEETPQTLPGSDGSTSETFPSSTKDSTNENKDKKTDETKDNKDAAKNSTNENATNNKSSNEAPATTTLPETGPEQLLILPVLAAVAYTVVAYRASLQRLSRVRQL